MKLFIFFSLVSFNLIAAPAAITIIDALRNIPANVRGEITLEKSLPIYKNTDELINYGIKVNANEGIGFSFNEKNLSILSGNGLILEVGGVPVQIRGIYYNAADGKFTVKTKTPLSVESKPFGIKFDLAAKTLNEKIEKVLNNHYKPKVIKAFEELKKIKSKKSLDDVNQVVNTITKIFSSDSNTDLPNLRATVNLEFNSEKNQQLTFGDWRANLVEGDVIGATLEFNKSPKKTNIKSIEFTSRKGIYLHGKTSIPEITSVNFHSMKLSEAGVQLAYDMGAEDVITGFQMVSDLIGLHSGKHPSELITSCDPVRLKLARAEIEKKLGNQISILVRDHRAELLAAGATPEFLAAFN
jgi:hypothetical protein